MLVSTDTAGFLILAKEADTAGRNRTVDIDRLEGVLDPEGTHVGCVLMLHEHVGGVLVEPHYRTQWYTKLRGCEEPLELYLDVDIALFKKHTTRRD